MDVQYVKARLGNIGFAKFLAGGAYNQTDCGVLGSMLAFFYLRELPRFVAVYVEQVRCSHPHACHIIVGHDLLLY